MNLNYAYYGLSYVLNRGAMVLILPMATRIFSLGELGLFELCQVTAQLSFGFIGLNGGESLLREGTDNPARGSQIFKNFFLWTILIGSTVFALTWVLPLSVWLRYGLRLGSIEAFFSLYFFYFRSKNQPLLYVTLSFVRCLGLLGLFTWGWFSAWQFSKMLDGQILLNLVIAASFALPMLRGQFQKVSLIPLLPYTLLLLPTGLAFWILNSSDKVMIQWLIGSDFVGQYHIVYSMGMIGMIANGALGLTLPQLMFKDKASILRQSFRIKLSRIVTSLFMFLFGLILVFICWDRNALHLIPEYPEESLKILAWAFSGFFALSFFYIPYSVCLWHRKADLLLKVTLGAALFNIILNLLLIPEWTLIGAAASTFFSYFLLSFHASIVAQKIEPELKGSKEEKFWAIGGISVIFAGAFFAELFFWP